MEHPGQNEAARRALCLGALVMRGKFESVAASATPQMHVVHEELATQLSIWIADEGLIAAQSTSEKLLITLNLFTPVENFIETAKLRPPAEIESARDLAELWHWRSRKRRRQEEGEYSEGLR